MPTRAGFPGSIVPGAAVGSAVNNTLPGGLIGYAETNAGTVNITNTAGAISNVDAVTIAPPVGAGRMLFVHASGILRLDASQHGAQSSRATDPMIIGAYEAQARIQVGGTIVCRRNYQLIVPGGDVSFDVWGFATALTGTPSFTLAIGDSGSSGAMVNVICNSQDAPTILYVLDVGPAF